MQTCSSGRQYADMQLGKAVCRHAAQESSMQTCSSGKQYADMHHCAMYMMELGKLHAFKYCDLDFATELQSEVRASFPRPPGTGSL
jgi:hypothetical protein